MPGLTPYVADQQMARSQQQAQAVDSQAFSVDAVGTATTRQTGGMIAGHAGANVAQNGVAGAPITSSTAPAGAPMARANATPPPPSPAGISADVAQNKAVTEVQRAAPVPTDEAVQVNATAPNPESYSASTRDQNASLAKAKKSAEKDDLSAAPSTSAESMALKQLATSQRWTISSTGQLQRSLDSGATWQPMLASEGVAFHVVASAGPQVWAGGGSAALFHSSDGGQQWTRIHPSSGDQQLTTDVVAIQLSKHGDRVRVREKNGIMWTSRNSGQSWSLEQK
jgi:hypothetical protein